MTIDQLINELIDAKQKLGTGDVEVPVVRIGYGENDYTVPDKVLTGDFVDQDGCQYQCALVGKSGGEEFTEKGTYHWRWNPLKTINNETQYE